MMDQLLQQHPHPHTLAHPHTRPPKRKADSQFDDAAFDEYDLETPTPAASPCAPNAELPDDDRPQKRRRANSLPNLGSNAHTDVEMHEQPAPTQGPSTSGVCANGVQTASPASPPQLTTDAAAPSQNIARPASAASSPTTRMATHDVSRPVCSALPLRVPTSTSTLSSPVRSSDTRLRSPSTPLVRPSPTRSVAHIPSLTPLITRETLKELDLEAILRNPQLRHDLLFDPGLQFRPTSGRKKRELTEKYWEAVRIEIESGCTCTSFDERGRRLPCVCGSSGSGSSRPAHPSRIPALVTELCEVLQSVVHTATADAALIAQELRHGVFDSRGVFKTLGAVLKQHCAPMRDRAVETMVGVAARPGGGVRAVRMCLEILELMKLDIANHQLQALRPYLFETAVEFELKTFQERHERGLLTLTTTQEWLRKAAVAYTAANPSTSSTPPPTLPLLAHALTSLIFSPPTTVSTPPPPTTTPLSQRLPHIAPPPGYPETLYLDHARLAGLTADAADLSVLYMLLMLFRQLVFSNSGSSASGAGRRKPVVLEDSVVDRVKREIWEVGPARLGLCFSLPAGKGKESAEWEKWRAGMRDVVLQVAVRAEEVRRGVSLSEEPEEGEKRVPTLPDAQTLALLESWMETNLKTGAPLERLLKARLERAVGDVVGRCVRRPASAQEEDVGAGAPAVAAGLEPLMPEIRHLGERIAKLVSFHGRVYRGLYEAEGFLA
ncbi:Tcp11-domain-containing protein [Ceratobasidium sp. AG-I]|nr:Tcp11-domain-containing protein [Ceratobasidium sp. AG-I]